MKYYQNYQNQKKKNKRSPFYDSAPSARVKCRYRVLQLIFIFYLKMLHNNVTVLGEVTGLKFNKEYFVIMIVLNSILLRNIRYFVSKICKMYYADFD